MKTRSVVVGALLAGAMLVGGQGVASANLAWCLYDPPALVQTASGASLSVNTQVYVSQSQVHLLRNVTENVATAPDGGGGTLVTVYVSLPAGITTAKVVANVYRYGVASSKLGQGGTVVTVYLDLPTN